MIFFTKRKQKKIELVARPGHRVLGVLQLQALLKTLLQVVYILLRANQGMNTT